MSRSRFLRWVTLLTVASGVAVLLSACSPSNGPETDFTAISQPTPTYSPFIETDPSTVVLAAGKPQLVEFFAFW